MTMCKRAAISLQLTERKLRIGLHGTKTHFKVWSECPPNEQGINANPEDKTGPLASAYPADKGLTVGYYPMGNKTVTISTQLAEENCYFLCITWLLTVPFDHCKINAEIN